MELVESYAATDIHPASSSSPNRVVPIAKDLHCYNNLNQRSVVDQHLDNRPKIKTEYLHPSPITLPSQPEVPISQPQSTGYRAYEPPVRQNPEFAEKIGAVGLWSRPDDYDMAFGPPYVFTELLHISTGKAELDLQVSVKIYALKQTALDIHNECYYHRRHIAIHLLRKAGRLLCLDSTTEIMAVRGFGIISGTTPDGLCLGPDCQRDSKDGLSTRQAIPIILKTAFYQVLVMKYTLNLLSASPPIRVNSDQDLYREPDESWEWWDRDPLVFEILSQKTSGQQTYELLHGAKYSGRWGSRCYEFLASKMKMTLSAAPAIPALPRSQE
ncbi:hypothetical protein TWF481_010378 [Arthrobotrys musiformis]|uniref:Uncharacterized protein n=1 Tax=Arthrobotrys musiformis TaxID=47236 RepID=A0AAV9W3F7_9PEZI